MMTTLSSIFLLDSQQDYCQNYDIKVRLQKDDNAEIHSRQKVFTMTSYMMHNLFFEM